MSYQNYVIAAYVVFGVVLVWDFVAPRLQLRAQRRVAALRSRRDNTRPPTPELTR